MPHMMPQIMKETWMEIDGPEGTEYIPLDEWAKKKVNDHFSALESGNKDHPFVKWLTERTINAYFYTHRVFDGFGARLSAPGYMDCTEWCAFDTEEEARAYLEETFEVCSNCGEAFWEDNPYPDVCHNCGFKYLT